MSVELQVRPLAAEEIAGAVGGELLSFGGAVPEAVQRIVTDSREASGGGLFCAIPGERFDGHQFIAAAVTGGCSLVLCERIPEEAKELSFMAVLVDSTVGAMNRLAGYYRSLTNIKVVGITGSVGKTTTKELVAAVLSAHYRTHKTVGNLNNTIGLPLSVFGIGKEDELAVLEMGMNHFEEISLMSRGVKPDIGVITNVGTAHLEFLGSREGICRAKMEIAEGMDPSSGLLILNGDEPLLKNAASAVAKEYFSLGKNGEWRGENIVENGSGMTFDAVIPGGRFEALEVPLRGLHNIGNALVAVAVGCKLGLTEEEIRRGMKNYKAAAMRQNIYEKNGILIIEDCYNANPESMKAALSLLKSLAKEKGGRATALLGDMLELGVSGPALHREIGSYAASLGIEQLFCYGPLSAEMGKSALENGFSAEALSVWTDTEKPEIPAEAIVKALKPGDVLLVKASRGIAAESVLRLCEKKWENIV